MHLKLIKNTDISRIALYRLTRIVYAETMASSLLAVEALASMIYNLRGESKRKIEDIINDENIFESLKPNSSRHKLLLIDTNRKDFQMCLRVVQKMLNNSLPDKCNGATMFHRDDVSPQWAMSKGYVSEIDGLFFYS